MRRAFAVATLAAAAAIFRVVRAVCIVCAFLVFVVVVLIFHFFLLLKIVKNGEKPFTSGEMPFAFALNRVAFERQMQHHVSLFRAAKRAGLPRLFAYGHVSAIAAYPKHGGFRRIQRACFYGVRKIVEYDSV